MIADRSTQHRKINLECIKNSPHSSLLANLNLHLSTHARKRTQVRRQLHTNHGSVCTSTDRTPGRSCTIAFQLSPASADTYTCPPVVPK